MIATESSRERHLPHVIPRRSVCQLTRVKRADALCDLRCDTLFVPHTEIETCENSIACEREAGRLVGPESREGLTKAHPLGLYKLSLARPWIVVGPFVLPSA
jgi:hypothetical protein